MSIEWWKGPKHLGKAHPKKVFKRYKHLLRRDLKVTVRKDVEVARSFWWSGREKKIVVSEHMSGEEAEVNYAKWGAIPEKYQRTAAIFGVSHTHPSSKVGHLSGGDLELLEACELVWVMLLRVKEKDAVYGIARKTDGSCGNIIYGGVAF